MMEAATKPGSAIDTNAGDNAPAVIVVQNVTKSFPTTLSAGAWLRYLGKVPRRKVLHDVSVEVRAGELFGLLGPNGAGKTTLLKMLATLCIPDEGRILIADLDAAKRPLAVKRKIGLCTSDERSFYYRLTGRQNLRFFGALAGLYGPFLEERIEAVASLVDLLASLDRRFDTFSSGMRQRLALARALLGDPEIVFLDEPTRAVDPLHAVEIRSLIRDELVVRRGKTAILATNLLDEAWAICDTVAILQHGRIVAKGAPQSLDLEFSRLARFRITLDGLTDDLLGRLESINGVVKVSWSPEADGSTVYLELDPKRGAVNSMLNVLNTSGVNVKALRSEDPQPLDVFVGLTREEDDSART